MSNFLSAIPALIGVVIGVIAAGWADRTRWKHSQTVRWDERRVDAYAEYAKVIKRTHMIALGIVDPGLADNLPERINREAGFELLTQAEGRRTEAWEAVLLLADQATAYAALQWHNIVKKEASFARRRPKDAESDDWIALVQSADEARDRFYEAARMSVSVGGGSVAIAQLLPAVDRAQVNRGQLADLL